MCNKRISVEYAVELGVFYISYLGYFGEKAKSYTIGAFKKEGQYFVEDPINKSLKQITEELYRKINRDIKKKKRPNRRTK
ncbi:MAG: hypothetical protein KQA41_03105 [Candidatus Aenigmarchaeota archaeon]|nr:hypothetical protein [Candidatus Aenigmarchaeota archaeon]